MELKYTSKQRVMPTNTYYASGYSKIVHMKLIYLRQCIISTTVGSEKSSTVSTKREDQQDATIRCLLITSVSTCFGHHYAHLQENKGPVTAFGVLFCITVVPHR